MTHLWCSLIPSTYANCKGNVRPACSE
ncbi:hypothetical protein A2U01_0097590, partial [Trifolium medium]|nr:hypothetical protein [Trifolium medium]